jgi:hypothetical protein
MGTVEKTASVPTHTDKELRKIAKDLIEHKIFTDRMAPNPELLYSIFMCLIFVDEKLMNDIKYAGLIYEYYSSASKMSINGYPIFYSFRMLTKEDSKTMFKYAREYKRLRDKFLGDDKFEIEVEDVTSDS